MPAESVADDLDFYEWVVDPNSPTGRREVVVIPHPSSLNRMYNSDGNRRRAGEVLREAMDKAREMEETKL
jgi:uracil-DNA glycosylase